MFVLCTIFLDKLQISSNRKEVEPMKKAISLIFAVILMMTVFVGCGGDGKEQSNDTASTPAISDNDFSTADIHFTDADNDAVYRVVRPDTDKNGAANAAVSVFKQMKSVLGVAVKNISDTTDGTDSYEILIGNTNRPESAKALDYLKAKLGGRYLDYIICSIGKKIVINAFCEEGLTAACEYFNNTFIKKEGVKGGIKFLKATEGNFTDITLNGKNIKDFYIVRPHFNSSYITQMQIEETVNYISKTTGYLLPVEEDEYVPEGANEIIVGNTNRKDVETIADRDSFIVKITGDKVYLNGGSPYATAMAVSEFTKALKNGAVNDSASFNGSYAEKANSYDSATYYKPMWMDDFDYSPGVNGVSNEKWWIISEDKTPFHAEGHNGKTSVRSTSPDVLRVEDGLLKMSAKFDDNYYYGGMLRSPYNLIYRYGYVEESAILPNGSGLWSSLWITSAGGDYCGQEIDINECFGNAKMVAANAHTWPSDQAAAEGWQHTSLDGNYGNEKKYDCPDGKNFGEDFHTFGYLWTPTEMTFTCDGEIYFSYELKESNTQDYFAFNTECQLILSLATGFASNGEIPDEGAEYWSKSNTLIVDYIHLYQIKDGNQLYRNGVDDTEYK